MSDDPKELVLDDPRSVQALLGLPLWKELTRRGGRVAFVVRADSATELGEVRTYLDENVPRIEAARMHCDRLAAVGEITAGVVHELRNMVSSIKGFAQIAKRNAARGEDVSELLERIESQADVSLDDFLGFARSGEKVATEFEVNKIATSSMTLVRHQLNMNGVKVDANLADGLPSVVGRRRDLQQVLVNLLLNAAQAMPEGGTISVRTELDDGHVVVSVRDQGPGVPAELRQRVFEPFFSTKPDGKGTGLGLAISRQLVERDGGTLALDDSPDGACFVVRLPCAKS